MDLALVLVLFGLRMYFEGAVGTVAITLSTASSSTNDAEALRDRHSRTKNCQFIPNTNSANLQIDGGILFEPGSTMTPKSSTTN